MSKINNVIHLFTDSNFRFNVLAQRGCFNHWSDEKFIKHKFKLTFGRELNLQNPQTFNEKLNWLKLYNRNPLYTTLADKYAVKKWVADKIGAQYIVPLLGVWKNANEINFDKLPNQFALKCTHNSGGRCICSDKASLNIPAVRNMLNKGLYKNYFYPWREWPYKDIHPQILAEQFLDDGSGHEITDYKFMCFNGEPKVMYITNKADVIFENFYDMDFKPLPIDRGFIRMSPEFQKPATFEEMKALARTLSQGIPWVRVDFFNINNHVYFGEFTFYDWGGGKKFTDPTWDKTLGEWLTLPPNKTK